YSIRDENRVFEAVAAYNTFILNHTGVEHPEQLDAAGVSPSFFRVMASQPLLGIDGLLPAPSQYDPQYVLSFVTGHSHPGCAFVAFLFGHDCLLSGSAPML